MRRHRRGLRLGLWLLPVWLPVSVFLIGNLWLASPPGCAWVASKIRDWIHLDARVGSVSVLPWNGITLDRVELLQPPRVRPQLKEPLASVKRIRITPVWRSWLRGNRQLQSIELDAPRGVLAIEMLENLAGQQSFSPSEQPPRPAPVVPLPQTGPPVSAPTAPAPQPHPGTAQPFLRPTVWIRVKNASFLLISAASGETRFELTGIDGDFPVAGCFARSRVKIASVDISGRNILSDFAADLEWQAPVLAMLPAETQVFRTGLKVSGKTALVSGLPLLLEFMVPRQKPEIFHFYGEFTAAAEMVAANARFQGLLLAPSTWQGDLLAETLAPSVRIGDDQAAFDHGRVVLVLRGGLLSCVDARLIGDELSLLGNGTLLADGRLAAVIRLVALPSNAAAIASRVFTKLPEPPSLTELSTPQRSAFDVEVFGDVRHVLVKAGATGPIIEFPTLPSP